VAASTRPSKCGSAAEGGREGGDLIEREKRNTLDEEDGSSTHTDRKTFGAMKKKEMMEEG
jgi:hypothetical protein